jgi:membrane-bound lytic murein transglycosylase D
LFSEWKKRYNDIDLLFQLLPLFDQAMTLKSISRSFFVLLFFLSLAVSGETFASEHPFPEYDCIKDNIAFWVKVYSEYPSTKGLIHDKDDLKLIYEVIDLLPEDAPNARRINRKRVDGARKKYTSILKKLAKGSPPSSPEEKRTASLFGSQPSLPRLLTASENIRVQRCLRDRFKEGLVRSGRYLEQVKQIFREKGLPADLAYLPHVESSFNYNAYSKFGAAGIWQFTHSTGKRYLTIDYAVDERRDPIASTHAAANYLKENFELLKSWPLAITAYNHGEAGILRAMEQKGSYERIFMEYEEGCFKFASRNFYSEFLAARKIARNAENYFGPLEIEQPLQTVSLTLPGFLPLREVLVFFQLDAETVGALNPALRHSIFSGQKFLPKGYKLRLPSWVDALLAGGGIPGELFKDNQKRSKFYRVKRGDTAGLIAARHKVKLQDLVLANNLDRRATVYIGQTLRIPGRGEGKVALVKAKPLKEKAAASPVLLAETEEEKQPTLNTETAAPKEPASSELKTISPRSPVIIFEAMQQKADQSLPPSLADDHLAVLRSFSKDGRDYGVIRVAPEETIGHFAEWLQISGTELKAANSKKLGRTIHTDQEIIVPFSKVDQKTFEERRLEYHREIEEDFFAAYHIEDLGVYQVQKGDSIWSICNQKLDLPVWLLKKYNEDIDFNALQPNQKLKVPQIVAQS